MNKHDFSPETLMMSYGYKPELSEGSVKSPIFQTSTFVFKNSAEGKQFFEIANGKPGHEGEEMGLIYSRINNPNLQILEERIKLWDGADDAAVFASGMSAVTTSLLAFLRPGDLLLYSNPIYGGSHKFIHHVLTDMGVDILAFDTHHTHAEIIEMLEASGKADKLRMIFIETPANPTNDLIDVDMCVALGKKYTTAEKRVLVAVDNTFMGPIWSHPMKHGADIVIYSATKYIGGHSDLIAGIALCNKDLMGMVKKYRTLLGNMMDPWTGWLIMRSLETLKIRMEEAARNTEVVAAFLKHHPKVAKVYYLGYISEYSPSKAELFKRQYSSNGAMVSFEIKGGEKEAFTVLDNLKLIKLAVSLGGTESLAEHPASMTHNDVPPHEKVRYNIGDNLIRLSVGIENPKDIIWDLAQALEKM